jgi:hypothetical protein
MTKPLPSAFDDHEAARRQQGQLASFLTGHAIAAVRAFCHLLPELPKACYPKALLGMGYLCEYFDLLFAVITCNIQSTQDQSDYSARYRAVQNVLRPFASEYGIEPDRPLLNTHRELFIKFYEHATGAAWPAHYAADPDNPWLQRGRYWAARMRSHLQRTDLGPIGLAKYNLGYHWAVEFVSIGEFEALTAAWCALGTTCAYLDAHCEVEPEHASCATAAIAAFTSLDDPLVVLGIRDHEDDLAGFYTDFTELVGQACRAKMHAV